MKKYFFIVFAIAFTAQINAQNNLVFNQVILLELTSSGTTVPEGKVWKVEDGQLGYLYLVNGLTWNIGGAGSYKSTPTWFPEGSVFKKYSGSNSLETLSILEFDVVPVSTTSTGSGGLSSEGLQFSRVINYSDDHRFLTNNLFWHDYEPIEIPQGKVWKITSINVSSMSISSNPNLSPFMSRPRDQTFVTIGDIISVFEEGTNGGSAYPYNNRSEEIWLNEGLKTIKVTNSASEKIRLTFTAIEYNIPQ